MCKYLCYLSCMKTLINPYSCTGILKDNVRYIVFVRFCMLYTSSTELKTILCHQCVAKFIPPIKMHSEQQLQTTTTKIITYFQQPYIDKQFASNNKSIKQQKHCTTKICFSTAKLETVATSTKCPACHYQPNRVCSNSFHSNLYPVNAATCLNWPLSLAGCFTQV